MPDYKLDIIIEILIKNDIVTDMMDLSYKTGYN